MRRRIGAFEEVAIAVALVLLVTLARIPFEPYLQYRAPFGLYFPVLAYVSWRAGMLPGIAALVVAAGLSAYVHLAPRSSILISDPSDLGALILFVISGISIIAIGEANLRTRHAKAQAEEALREANTLLEKRIEERTQELVKKNEELEGFSYAISHDLRAPIRAIVARSRIVLDEESEKLSSEGQENLERLSKAGKELGLLVDDLLTYARTGKRDPDWSDINLSELVRETFEIVHAESMASADLAVQENLHAVCDPVLMQLVLHNLIENSFKYLRPEVPLRIEFGASEDREGTVFFLRDNGAGFDMAYADKLFRPFSRLHNVEGVAGTGIGLANVKRAMQSQGGAVWIDSAPGKGTTVFFTLPVEAASKKPAMTL